MVDSEAARYRSKLPVVVQWTQQGVYIRALLKASNDCGVISLDRNSIFGKVH